MLYVLLYVLIGFFGLLFNTGMEVSFDKTHSKLPPNVLRALAIMAMTFTALFVVIAWPYLLVRSLMVAYKTLPTEKHIKAEEDKNP